ncbi:hypothetical protein [Haloarcula amylovorans]|uniref:hypothetical protein n=1 Tax=Haloarcula amylovorans TaxID=2562280 RepID=UPI001075D9D7|nr:hypothetical protein [Halomicroarcula amylolytica]
MTDDEQVKAALSALADGESATAPESSVGDRCSFGRATSEREASAASGSEDYHAVVERAATATTDVEAAAQFVEDVGLDALESAVEQAEREVSELATEGRAALTAFERFQSVADSAAEG